jgi:hypothetical protein
MSTTGTSARIFAPNVLRPIRRWSWANGSGASSTQGMISPSSTVPFGSQCAASVISG